MADEDQKGAEIVDTIRKVMSDDAVRAIASSVQKVVVASVRGQGSVIGTPTVSLAASLRGQGSLVGSAEVLSEPALPADALNFFQTPLGGAILAFFLQGLLALYQVHHEDVSQHQTEQYLKQIAQTFEQLLLSQKEHAQPTPAPKIPEGD